MTFVSMFILVIAAPFEIVLMLPSSARIGFVLPKNGAFVLMFYPNTFIQKLGAGAAVTTRRALSFSATSLSARNGRGA
jgi:hypothetical protein